ncbi:MAG: hypothetical protein F7B18_06620 [Desulfurococcales archaeon]|nr:hypothetical protein [Desulfurococcales archaeon]
MPCPSLKAITRPDRPGLRPVRVRIVYRDSGELGAMLTGLLSPGLSLTIPIDPAGLDTGELAEALCCAPRTSPTEAIFNIATAIALIIGSATGIREAIILGLAGMAVTLIQYLARLVGSRRLCRVTPRAVMVAGLVKGLTVETLRAVKGCRPPCGRLIAYGGQVYRVEEYSEYEGGVEVILEPMGSA